MGKIYFSALHKDSYNQYTVSAVIYLEGAVILNEQSTKLNAL